jgi:hypothetical protein
MAKFVEAGGLGGVSVSGCSGQYYDRCKQESRDPMSQTRDMGHPADLSTAL